MRNSFLKRHWRIILPIATMGAIFCLELIPYSAWRGESWAIPIIPILFALLGASWYYYLRTLSSFTPGFTFCGSLLLASAFAIFYVFYRNFSHPDQNIIIFEILILTAVNLVGIIIFAALHYATRSQSQKQARRKQIAKIWAKNAKLLKKPKK